MRRERRLEPLIVEADLGRVGGRAEARAGADAERLSTHAFVIFEV